MAFRACSTFAALLLGAGALLSLPTGCETLGTLCRDAGCISGFEWQATTQDGSPLTPGDYQLSVTLDGATYEVTCTVVNPEDSSSTCSQVSRPADGSFDLDAYVTWEVEGVPLGFYLFALDSSPTAESLGGYGPQTVEIAVRFADAPLFAVAYEVEYEVDEDFRGDPSCGACELPEAYTYTW